MKVLLKWMGTITQLPSPHSKMKYLPTYDSHLPPGFTYIIDSSPSSLLSLPKLICNPRSPYSSIDSHNTTTSNPIAVRHHHQHKAKVRSNTATLPPIQSNMCREIVEAYTKCRCRYDSITLCNQDLQKAPMKEFKQEKEDYYFKCSRKQGKKVIREGCCGCCSPSCTGA